MKRGRMKKQWRQAVFVIACSFTALQTVYVYAGGINAAEQTVIDYYNQTFSYDGKTYTASEAAKSSVYQKLAADGVDLTERQAKSAIRQASKNIKKGIEEGYLVEVQLAETPENTERRPDTTEEQGEEGSSESRETTENQSGLGTEKDSKKPPVLETEAGTEALSGKENSSQDEATESSRRIDVEKLLEAADREGEQYLTVQSDDTSAITAEQYPEGKLLAVSEEGCILFQGGLPLKNTGYHTGGFWVVLSAGLGLLLASLTAGILWIWKHEAQRKRDKAGLHYE